MDVSLLVFLILVILVVTLAVLLNRRWAVSRVSHRPKYSYIPPITLNHHSGWIKTKHPSKWVKARLLNAPEYEPVQGIHYYPYCRGRHFEYVADDERNIYRRKLQSKH